MSMDLPAELEKLAKRLQAKATTARAMAHEHAQAKDLHESERQERMAKGGEHFAAVCMEAARKLRTKAKREKFASPSWEETLEQARAKFPQWPVSDVLGWWQHFESVGWRIGAGSGKPMVDWRLALANGWHRWAKENPQRAAAPSLFGAAFGASAKGDPAGWAEWLRSVRRPYKAYRYEQEHIRLDFEKAQRP